MGKENFSKKKIIVNVSVIIPCYNSELFIHESIQSVLAQSYAFLELILVDNNSTDNTWEILNQYAREYPQFIKLTKAHKQGAPATRNKGLELATGDWIQFLDSDDYLRPDKIDHQVELIKEGGYHDYGAVLGSYLYQMPGGKFIKVFPQQTDELYKAIFTSRIGTTSANLYNRSALEKVGNWEESLQSNQENELLFRMVQNGYMVAFDLAIRSEVRFSPRSISANFKAGAHNSAKMRHHYARILEKSHPKYFEENRPFFNGLIFHHVRQYAKHDYKAGTELFQQLLPLEYLPEMVKNNKVNRLDRLVPKLVGMKLYFFGLYLIRQWVWLPVKNGLIYFRRTFSDSASLIMIFSIIANKVRIELELSIGNLF